MVDKTGRRSVLKAAATGIVGTAAASGTAAADHLGLYDPVYANEGTCYLHDSPTAGDWYRSVREDTGMFIIDGPQYNDGYTWWYVEHNGDYDDYRKGRAWVADKELSKSMFAYASDNYFTASHGDGRGHDGVDIAHGSGNSRPVLAAAGGTAYTGWRSGYGYTIEVKHTPRWSTLYAHLSNYRVANGESVSRFQTIGDTGSSGGDYKIHLHQEVRSYDDPQGWPHETYDKYGRQIQMWYRTGFPNEFRTL